MDTETLFYLVCGGAALAMGVYYLRRRHKIRSVLFGALTGLAALFLVHRYGAGFGADLPLNAFNIAGGTVLGAPFVAVMIIIKYL